jgi:hypothetical protein
LDAFISLLGYFPNLRELNLCEPTFSTEHRTTPPPSIPLRGVLCLCSLSVHSHTDILLLGLCGLKLEYDELEMYGVHGDPSHVRSLISTCEKSLKRLLLGSPDCKFRTPHGNITSTA